jgi:hypothetical protein
MLDGAVHNDHIDRAFNGEGVGLAYDNWVGGDDCFVTTSHLCCRLDAKNGDDMIRVGY